MRAVLKPYAEVGDSGLMQVRFGDGEADVYLNDSGMMANHVSGEDPWDLLVRGATAANWAILPVGCPTCLTRAEQAVELPPELSESDTVVVTSGADLLAVVRS